MEMVMSYWYRGSLFFSIGVVGFLLGVVSNQLYSTMVYNQVQNELELYLTQYTHGITMQQESMIQSVTAKLEELSTKQVALLEEELVEVAVTQDLKIDNRTIYVVEEYDSVSGEITENIDVLPAKYIGLDRELLEAELALYTTAPNLLDQQKGFVSASLVSFSPEKIVIRKTYYVELEVEIPDYYYLRMEEGSVIVYEHDLQTIYMRTDISFESLPTDIQEEIVQIKKLESEAELYNFLEAYSS